MKINLEKELVKENVKLATPKELLLIKEYERQTELVENNALERIGLNKNIKSGRFIKNTIDSLKKETLKFNQERVSI